MKPFEFNKNKMLFHRVGPMSGQVQTHTDGNIAPVRKGAWFFPYPYFDWFFAFQTYERFMPPILNKKCEDFETEEEWEEHLVWMREEGFAKREAWIKEKGKNIPHTKKRPYWHGGVVYSKIFDRRHGQQFDDLWFVYDTPKDFALAAKKTLIGYSNWGDYGGLTKLEAGRNLSVDHLEVFLPIT